MLRMPVGSKVAECGACGAKVNNVEFDGRLNYHLNRLSRRVSNVVQDALGETVAAKVTLPEGVRGGDTIHVQAGPGGETYAVKVPHGLEPGQAFIEQVPRSKFAAPGMAARTEAAPAVAPVAEVAGPGGYPQHASPQPPAPQPGDTAAEAVATLEGRGEAPREPESAAPPQEQAELAGRDEEMDRQLGEIGGIVERLAPIAQQVGITAERQKAQADALADAVEKSKREEPSDVQPAGADAAPAGPPAAARADAEPPAAPEGAGQTVSEGEAPGAPETASPAREGPSSVQTAAAGAAPVVPPVAGHADAEPSAASEGTSQTVTEGSKPASEAAQQPATEEATSTEESKLPESEAPTKS